MFFLSNKRSGLLLFLVATVFFSACRETAQQFSAPVERVIRLDSTLLGISTVISDLQVPWEIAWGPDGQIWFTEQHGIISKVDPHTGEKTTLLHLDGVYHVRTLGLLGMAVSRDKSEPYVFIDYTHQRADSSLISRLVRYTYTSDTLRDPKILLEVPASTGHNGSRIAISPDGKVFWSVGDIAKSKNAQDTASLNGKILRLNMDGSIPRDNPFPGSPVWSMGHRNIQGLVFLPDGTLLSSEHGDATDDEINIIRRGGNYGWPQVRGYADRPEEKSYDDTFHTVAALRAWTPTIAPSGIDYYHSGKIAPWKGAILLATLKGESLRVLKMNAAEDSIRSEIVYFKGLFGRLRDICISDDGDIYLSTSNLDWNPLGKPREHDDRIIRLATISNLDNLSEVDTAHPFAAATVSEDPSAESMDGTMLYQSYCASCHKADGRGVAGTFPALDGNPLISGNKSRLISFVLQGGASGKTTNQAGEAMPAFNFLRDEQLASILTYIRTAWTNRATPVTADDIRINRQQP